MLTKILENDAHRYASETEYHITGGTYPDRVKNTFGKDLPKIRHGRILDMGCSIGQTTIELATRYPDSTIIGIDINPCNLCLSDESISDARQGFDRLGDQVIKCSGREYKMPTGFILGDGFRPPFPDNTFNAVFCMNNIYYMHLHRTNEHVRRRLPQIANIVKPGGYLLVSGNTNYIILRKIKGTLKEHRISDELCSLKHYERLF